MTSRNKLVEKLQEIGFNRLESEVYITLLEQSPLSGYRISHIIDEGPSNIYKALDSLKKRGAIMMEERPGTKHFTAVPAVEYLAGVTKQIKQNITFLENHLPDKTAPVKENRVFTLETIDQILERSEDMIKNAEKQIIVDAFPEALSWIKKHLEKRASEMSINIIVNSYDGESVKNCTNILKSAGKKALETYSKNWMNLVVDNERYLLAVVDKDNKKTVHHAVWTNSPYLSFVIYSGIGSEMMFSLLIETIRKHGQEHLIDEIKSEYTEKLVAEMPGFI